MRNNELCPECKRRYGHLEGCTVEMAHRQLDAAILNDEYSEFAATIAKLTIEQCLRLQCHYCALGHPVQEMGSNDGNLYHYGRKTRTRFGVELDDWSPCTAYRIRRHFKMMDAVPVPVKEGE